MSRPGTGLALVSIVATAATFHVACDLVFACGCTWIFAGGDAHCDIRVPGPPDCPPCANWALGAAFGAALFGGWWIMARGALAATRLAWGRGTIPPAPRP